jgi:hypothetical protein
MIRPHTLALIEDGHRFSAVYGGYLADHVPMGLVALDGMGASDEDLDRFKRFNDAKLEPLGAAERGRIEGFERRIRGEGLAGVVAALAPDLARGIGTAAFHGAIRLAYGVESGNVREQAHALAYWVSSLGPLPSFGRPAGSEPPLAIFAAISRDPALAGKRPSGRNIAERMEQAARAPSFAHYVARLDPLSLRVASLAAALIRAYGATGDFTLLHGVTGCHAFRRVAALFPDKEDARAKLWTAVVAAYIASGSPPPDGWKLEGRESLSWTEIHRAARACDDEHDVKFAYSCWREWEAYGDDLYRRAASARVSHSLGVEAH